MCRVELWLRRQQNQFSNLQGISALLATETSTINVIQFWYLEKQQLNKTSLESVACKTKLPSVISFKLLCVNSRKDQELRLKERIKRVRYPGESPNVKRVYVAADGT